MRLNAKFFLPAVLFTSMLSMSGQSLPAFNSHSDVSAVVSNRQSYVRPGQRPFTFGTTTFSVSSLGGQLQITTNLSRQTGLRGTYSWLFWKDWASYNNFTTHGLVAVGSMGLMLDFYPFKQHTLRFTPGLLLHNSEVASGDIPLTTNLGGVFTVNGHQYYSASQPVKYDPDIAPADQGPVHAYEGVNLRRTAVTITTGWGNLASSHNERHLTFPVELGVAFMGTPTMRTGFISGQLCDAAGQNCTPASKSEQLRKDIDLAFAGYQNRLRLLKAYPILSCGVAYHFKWRHARGE